MAKDLPKSGEAGTAAPAEQPQRVGPVPATVEPEPSTRAVALGSPLDHAKASKQVRVGVERVARVNNEPATFDVYSPQHLAAAALHGWKEHEHHAAVPIQLSAEDYEKALAAAYNPVTRIAAGYAGDKGKPGDPIDSTEAANQGIPTITDYEPHKPALSPHQGKG